MPNALDNFSLYVVVAGGSGSLNFDEQGAVLPPAGGSFEAAFMYAIGNPAATEPFEASWTKNSLDISSRFAPSVNITPRSPITTRPQGSQQGGSQSGSEMESVPPDELQSGTVTGRLPINPETSTAIWVLELLMVQPDT